MEMKDLEERLTDNYYRTQSFDESIANDLLTYINAHPIITLPDEDIFLMKKFSKNCSILMKKDIDLTKYGNKTPEFSFDQLEWLYLFNKEIMFKIFSLYDLNDCERAIYNIYNHLFSHNANIAIKLAEIIEKDEDKISFLNTAVSNFEKTISLSEKEDRIHCAYQISSKGHVEFKIGKLMMDRNSSLDWFKKAHSTLKEGVTRIEGLYEKDEKVLNFNYNLLFDVCSEIYDILETLETEDPVLKKKNKDDLIFYLNESYKILDKRNMLEKIPKDSVQFGYINTLKADLLFKLGKNVDNVNEKIKYFKMAYDGEVKGAKFVKKEDSRHSMMSFMNAGKSAYELYNITEDDKFRVDAITNYSIFINQFDKNPESDLMDLYKKIIRIVDELKRSGNSDSDYDDFADKRGRKRNKDRHRQSDQYKHIKKWQNRL